MNKKDIKIYLRRYNERLNKYGYSLKSLGWSGNKSKQNLRFLNAFEIGIGRKDSVLDIGCGFGDFYFFLKKKKWSGEYLGLDINNSFLKIAKDKYFDAKFVNKAFLNNFRLKKYDWVISLGSMNAKLKYSKNISYIKKMITKMILKSKKGIVCDFMHADVNYVNSEAFHLDYCDLLTITKNFSNRKILKMDYLPYEYMLYIYRDNNKL